MGRTILKDKGICHYCRAKYGTTTDHIVPRAFGGPDSMWNYVPSCEPCNLMKGADWPTCECERCLAAVTRFLSSPTRRIQTLARLARQGDELTEGITALNRRAKQLGERRKSLRTLYAIISTWPSDPEILSESVVKSSA